ncbi:T9SS type A sorting domain-containing protein [Chryseobacterium jejuense]|uniref:Por secretion system C-terminal sorting domain n=1 Tax=Chryseobacterium jejuense TaxID=445960 RepID=A0A2X2X7T8_CHRJE|nr:T9SS type A sorting domain-containing protein [Chryseobacterium jejuense]SDJ55137.1 Por secretion system C-terminal sorting domain-containing protein [Chryseobacterium jejuense]SQB46233.1 Por secretion system C-terminal sorting domain [Chryseobacterium jejuense]
MKKTLLTLGLLIANFAWAQFSSGTVALPATGMTVKLDTTPTGVTLTLTGNSNYMLGIGFGTTGMASGSDGFIYNSTANRDYTFIGKTMPNADPSQDWTETSNTVSGSTRTIVATRSLSGGAGDFAIPNAAGTINIFYASKTGNTLGYHDVGRDYATLTMASSTLSTNEVTAANKKISLYPNPAKTTVNFKNVDKINSLEVYDATGRKVKSIKPDGENISVEDLKPGTYYFEIKLKDGSLSYEKLIKE